MVLTKRQHQVLSFLQEFIEREGYCPSYEEIAEGLKLSSLATVHAHLATLEKKGYVRRGFNQSRSIELRRLPARRPQPPQSLPVGRTQGIERLEPQPSNPCIGCGGGNPRGLKLTFALDHDRRKVLGRFRLGREYQGSQGVLHGGIIALLLDEAMGKLTRFHKLRAVTAELRVEYLRPIQADEEIQVEAEEVGHSGREFLYRAVIANAAGQQLATSHGRFVAVGKR